jgi:hypothetical protein
MLTPLCKLVYVETLFCFNRWQQRATAIKTESMEEANSSSCDDDVVVAVVGSAAAVAASNATTTNLLASTTRRYGSNHRTQRRKKRRVFDHTGALQCMNRDYLGLDPLYGKEFHLMFRLFRPRDNVC